MKLRTALVVAVHFLNAGYSAVAQDALTNAGRLMARGSSDAPSATVLISGDTGAGGQVVSELRIVEGQRVAKNAIVAVLSGYTLADSNFRVRENELAKVEHQYQSLITGFRLIELDVQRAVVRSAELNSRLKRLELPRSGKPLDTQSLEQELADQDLIRERRKQLQLSEALNADRATMAADIDINRGLLESARLERELTLVRAPIAGMIVQIFARKGERLIEQKLAKIVDLGQVRVFADIDDIHLGRIAVNGKVTVVFRGNAAVHSGRIVRVEAAVKWMLLVEREAAWTNDSRIVQVEIALDDPTQAPQFLGREARVTFL